MTQPWSYYVEGLKGLIVARIAKRFAAPTYNDAAEVLAEVLNEEMDAGFDFTDEQLEEMARVMDRYDAGDEIESAVTFKAWKDRV